MVIGYRSRHHHQRQEHRDRDAVDRQREMRIAGERVVRLLILDDDRLNAFRADVEDQTAFLLADIQRTVITLDGYSDASSSQRIAGAESATSRSMTASASRSKRPLPTSMILMVS
jgi:hypothetical protein